MFNEKINAYLDFNLTKKLESFVINALPELSRQSDFNMLYLADIAVEEIDGVQYQSKITSEDSIFLSISNDLGHIDFDLIKIIQIAGVIESDFEVMEYTPNSANIKMFANYYEGHEVPIGGGYLHVAICPFGVNKVELLNGDVIHLYGTGKYKITKEQGGFRKYAQIPKVNEILSNNYFKVLKLAIYSRYKKYGSRKYSLNLFSPTMKKVKEPIIGQLDLSRDDIIYYSTNKTRAVSGMDVLVDEKDNSNFPIRAAIGPESNLFGIGKMLKINKDGYIDLSSIANQLGDEFSIHMNMSVNSYAPKGTILFEIGYGVSESGFQTHHITLWLDKNGEVTFNCQYSDDRLGTGYILKKDIEHTITFTIENQKYDAADNDEYMCFIHIDGAQIWPKNKMLTATQKIYLWRAMEAYKTYNEVCMQLPAPYPINGGLDAKDVCSKKLLHESGFMTLKNLGNIYRLYLDRPRASKADLNTIVLNSSDDTTTKKFFIGQDSEKDIFDNEYYFDGAISEVLVTTPGLAKEEIEQIHLLNTTKMKTVK